MAVVKKLRRKNRGLLVEYEAHGRLRRVIVPPETVDEEGSVDDEILAMGIPYGVRWGKLIGGLTANEVEDALHRAGIWTLDDLRQDPMAAVGALQQAHGAYVNRLTIKATQGDQNGNSN